MEHYGLNNQHDESEWHIAWDASLRLNVEGGSFDISQYHSVSKSNWLHVDIFWFSFIELGYIL